MKIINYSAVCHWPPLRLLNWACIATLALGVSSVWSQTAAGNERSPLRFRDVTQSDVLALPAVEIGDASAQVAASNEPALELNEFLQRALDISPQLQQVRAQLEMAQSGRKIARADLLPSFSLRHATGPEQSQTLQLAPDKHTYRQSTVRLTQPLYNAPLSLELAASRQAETSAEFRFQSAYDNVLMSVVRSTVDLASTRLVLDFSNVQLAQLQNILNYLETRVSAGAASPADLERARTRVLNARQIRIEQQAAYRNALLELSRLNGLTPLAIRLPDASRFPDVAVGSSQLQTLALAQNPDLRALQLDIEAQQSRIKAEMTKYLPVVGVSLEHDNSKNVQGTNGPHTNTRALLVATWATSLGGKEWHQAEQARAELRSREAKLTDESQRLSQALEGDMALLQSAALRIQTAQLEQASAAKVVEAVAEQLKTGRLGSLLDALDASERFFSARQRLVQSMGQNIKAHAQILQRTGQLRDIKP
jgi:adhesin transport system outer membrane protein